MRLVSLTHRHVAVPTLGLASLAAVLALASPPAAAQAGSIYYVCPGNVFTNTITAKEADARGCKAKEAQQPTTIAGPKPRPATSSSAASAAPRASDAKVDPAEQRARDTDSRRILQQELQKAEDQLAALKKQYNNGEPERQGDEKNYQRYLDRVADLKSSIARTEADVAALKRELAKLPAAGQ